MDAGPTEVVVHMSVLLVDEGEGDTAVVGNPAAADDFDRNSLTEGGFATLTRSLVESVRSCSRELLEVGGRIELVSLAPSAPGSQPHPLRWWSTLRV